MALDTSGSVIWTRDGNGGRVPKARAGWPIGESQRVDVRIVVRARRSRLFFGRQGLRGGVAGGDLARRGDPLPLPADYAVDRAEAIALGTVTS